MVEYSLALVLIGLTAALVIGFVGDATSDVFDEVGNTFPAKAFVAPLDDGVGTDLFDDLFARIDGIDSLGNSLVGKVEDARSRYLGGDVGGAVAKLDSLIKQVDAQQGKQLSYDEAASVRNGALQLIAIIETG